MTFYFEKNITNWGNHKLLLLFNNLVTGSRLLSAIHKSGTYHFTQTCEIIQNGDYVGLLVSFDDNSKTLETMSVVINCVFRISF